MTLQSQSIEGPPLRISGCVITLNEAARIGACLDSLAICDEIVVVDSHSTDLTREIAAGRGARVIERDWPGFRSQKQFTVDAASHDWVLILDADETLSPRLVDEIRALKASGSDAVAAWDMPRLSTYFGRTIRHGDWYPDRQLRLFDRRRARFAGLEVHEKVDVDGAVRHLRGDILHDSFESLDDQLEKRTRYARLVAEGQHARGKRGSWIKVFANPAWRFLRGYVVKAGFLDGWRGLSLALIAAKYVREKHLRLVILDRAARERARHSSS